MRVLLVIAALLAWWLPRPEPSPLQDSSSRVRVVVRYRNPGGPVYLLPQARRGAIAELRSHLESLDAILLASFPTLPFLVINLPRASLAALRADPLVESVVEDRLLSPALDQSVPRVGAPVVWSAGYRGTGQAVVTIDTGVDPDHSFLRDRLVDGACFSDRDAPSQTLCPNGTDTQYGEDAAIDCAGAIGCGHGTHVSGIAVGGAPGIALRGVAPEAQLIAIQVFHRRPAAACGGAQSCVLAWMSDVARGLDWVDSTARLKHPVVAVNISLGGGAYQSAAPCDADHLPIVAAVARLRSHGIAVIAASGNDGSSTALHAPACVSGVVSVGSTVASPDWGTSDTLSYFTNTSPELDLLAPGQAIRSSLPENNYGYDQGTSMASPHVAGAWALLKQARPDASVDTILDALKQSGLPVRDTRNGLTFAWLRVDLALQLVGVDPGRTPTPSPTMTRTPSPTALCANMS